MDIPPFVFSGRAYRLPGGSRKLILSRIRRFFKRSFAWRLPQPGDEGKKEKRQILFFKAGEHRLPGGVRYIIIKWNAPHRKPASARLSNRNKRGYVE